jgi:hypothetical protein
MEKEIKDIFSGLNLHLTVIARCKKERNKSSEKLTDDGDRD